MNYTYHPAIRESLSHSEVVNARCEVSIPLYKLRKELESIVYQSPNLWSIFMPMLQGQSRDI